MAKRHLIFSYCYKATDFYAFCSSGVNRQRNDRVVTEKNPIGLTMS